jgi:hypothetical protein
MQEKRAGKTNIHSSLLKAKLFWGGEQAWEPYFYIKSVIVDSVVRTSPLTLLQLFNMSYPLLIPSPVHYFC